jgi:DNA-binding NarL/FixJ family response regulator
MKTLICDTSFRATKLLEKILVKLPQISEIVVAHELVEVKKVLKANKIQVVFLSLDFAQVINKKTLLDLFGKVPVILLLQPRVKPFFSPEILLISDGIVLNNSTDLEFQIMLVALKIDLGQKIVESKLIKPKGNSPLLTNREMQILHYLSVGKSNLRIAQELKIAVPTVKTHVRKILLKLNATNRTHGVAQGIRWSLI